MRLQLNVLIFVGVILFLLGFLYYTHRVERLENQPSAGDGSHLHDYYIAPSDNSTPVNDNSGQVDHSALVDDNSGQVDHSALVDDNGSNRDDDSIEGYDGESFGMY